MGQLFYDPLSITPHVKTSYYSQVGYRIRRTTSWCICRFASLEKVWRTHGVAGGVRTPHSCISCPHITTVPIFESGKLMPGVYRIQNIVGQTYVDTLEHTKELCCQPSTLLEGKGLASPCSKSTRKTVLIAVFSGKSYLRVLDILCAGYGVVTCSSHLHTEVGDAGGTRDA